MTISSDKFLDRFAETVMADRKGLSPGTELRSIETWDSMALVSVVALLDELGAKPTPGALEKCQTIGDIIALVP
jgi:acyl carrier protein